MKCITYQCENHKHEGGGQTLLQLKPDGTVEHIWICNPCFSFVRDMWGGQNSQVERNAMRKITTLAPEKLKLNRGKVLFLEADSKYLDLCTPFVKATHGHNRQCCRIQENGVTIVDRQELIQWLRSL